MMGVYIKGFQLPEKSDMYYVKVECEAGKNPVATIWRKDLMGKMSFGAFEVVPVPPHGRLIDADALEAHGDCLSKLHVDFDAPSRHQIWRECVPFDDIPTVIPAEEAKDTNVPIYDLLYEEGGLDT